MSKYAFKDIYENPFKPIFHFYTPWKRQETFGFLTFSEGIEMTYWVKVYHFLMTLNKY